MKRKGYGINISNESIYEFLGRFAIWEAIFLIAKEVFMKRLNYNPYFFVISIGSLVWLFLPLLRVNGDKKV